MKKDIWIQKVMDSSKDFSKQLPSDEVWKRIQNSIRKPIEMTFSRKQVFAIAASLILLVAVNLSLFTSSSSKSTDATESALKQQLQSSFVENIYGEV
jgi:hypothetical protein